MVEALDQELSHSAAISDITAERDEYAGVPLRPGTVEALEQELSHVLDHVGEEVGGQRSDRIPWIDPGGGGFGLCPESVRGHYALRQSFVV